MNFKNLLTKLNKRPIAYYPVYRFLTGSTTAGIYLSQIMYWDSKMDGKEFYKTDAEIMEETLLSERELKTAKSRLKKMPFLTIKAKGSPPTSFYRVDHKVLAQCIEAGIPVQIKKDDSSKSKRTVRPNQKGRFVQIEKDDSSETIHKTTTEITHKTTTGESSELKNSHQKPVNGVVKEKSGLRGESDLCAEGCIVQDKEKEAGSDKTGPTIVLEEKGGNPKPNGKKPARRAKKGVEAENWAKDWATTFEETYKRETGLDFAFSGKDFGGLREIKKKLSNLHRKKHGKEAEERVLFEAFEWLVEKSFKLREKDNFLFSNLTIPLINSQFNQILNKSKNGTKAIANRRPQDQSFAEKTAWIHNIRD